MRMLLLHTNKILAWHSFNAFFKDRTKSQLSNFNIRKHKRVAYLKESNSNRQMRP